MVRVKTFVYVGTSLDGFLAKKDGNIDWLNEFQSQEVFESYKEFIGTIDAIVIGRGTFESVLTFSSWPYDKPVFILSSTLTQIPEKLKGNATLISMKPKELLKHLERKGFSNIYVDGGKVIQGFLREDCIDEMIITRIPILLGEGIPLFGPLGTDLRFEHVRTSVLANGLVKSWYRRKQRRG